MQYTGALQLGKQKRVYFPTRGVYFWVYFRAGCISGVFYAVYFCWCIFHAGDALRPLYFLKGGAVHPIVLLKGLVKTFRMSYVHRPPLRQRVSHSHFRRQQSINEPAANKWANIQ
jgi:hypothetical protein